MEIKELTSLSDANWQYLDVLMKQMSDEKLVSRGMIEDVVNDPNSHLFAIFDGDAIVGCATLSVYYSPTGRKACIEDVVVHTDYRGQHLGRMLLEHLISEARTMSPIEIHLTSRPVRVAANALYQSLGFVKRDTNFYKMVL